LFQLSKETLIHVGKMRISNYHIGVVAAVCWAIISCAGSPRGSKDSSISNASGQEVNTDEIPSDAAALHWFHDAYEQAVDEARKQNRPLVIDMWANWCHTCLSMKHFVLEDGKITTYADRFVWLSLDTDKETNAQAMERFPVKTWPTFFVVDPRHQSVLTRYQGAASVDQFASFLEQGERMFAESKVGDDQGSQKADLLNVVRRADQAALEEDWTTAAQQYRTALRTADPDWPRRPDLLVSLIGVLAISGQWSDCVQLGITHMNDTGSSASAADFAYYATSCIRSLDKNDKRGPDLLKVASARLNALTADDKASLSVDDRSDALRILREIQIDRGEQEAAISTAQRQLTLLDKAANEAPSPAAAATYNWPRSEVYVYLGRGQDLIPLLEASSRALPHDYDPPYRIAWVALKVGDLDTAYGAAKRACGLAYGPRKGNALNLLAEILKARGEKAAELQIRKETVEHYESLPPGHFSQLKLDRARQALADLEKPN
jgi:thiol-disulfide isomerase/thioredoxin